MNQSHSQVGISNHVLEEEKYEIYFTYIHVPPTKTNGHLKLCLSNKRDI